MVLIYARLLFKKFFPRFCRPFGVKDFHTLSISFFWVDGNHTQIDHEFVYDLYIRPIPGLVGKTRNMLQVFL